MILNDFIFCVKVCFSGKKGRPRQLRPWEKDPHAQERNEIKVIEIS